MLAALLVIPVLIEGGAARSQEHDAAHGLRKTRGLPHGLLHPARAMDRRRPRDLPFDRLGGLADGEDRSRALAQQRDERGEIPPLVLSAEDEEDAPSGERG